MRGLSFLLVPTTALAAMLTVAGCSNDPGTGTPDAGTPDSGPVGPIPCTMDSECTTYCNPGSHFCCAPADPPYEICGDMIDQNCDRRDESCGDNDGDGVQACRPGEDPLGGCDCDDERADVRPPFGGTVPGAPELCDGVDNDCNGRIDEASACCDGCASLGADRGTRADICTETGECDCSTEPGIGPCAPGLSCCSGGCTDVTSDVANCGFCGAPCTAQADTCMAGACMCGAMPPCDFTFACSAGACAMM